MKNILLIATFVVALFGCSKNEEDSKIVINPYLKYAERVGDKITPKTIVCYEYLYMDNNYVYVPFGLSYNIDKNPTNIGHYCSNLFYGFSTRLSFTRGYAAIQESGSIRRYEYRKTSTNEIELTLYENGRVKTISLYKQF